jgi:pyruvate kinase
MNSNNQEFKRTRIVCTMGPANDNDAILRGMIDAGMDVGRFNLSHGTIGDHIVRLERLRRISSDAGRIVAAMFDTRGPDIRIGDLATQSVELVKGHEFILTKDPVAGTVERVQVNYPGLPAALKPGDPVFLNDGLIELEVVESNPDQTRCVVIAGGTLTAHKGVNTPGKLMPLPILTDRDISDLLTVFEKGIDYIAASFIRTPQDIRQIRSLLGGTDIPIIAKIETSAAVTDLENVIREADGAMVARGDLGIEIPPENVPGVQKRIIKIARLMCKPVITATEMLESMVNNPRPTRAEIADVANAVLDRTSAVMLSEETAIGKYPVQAVTIMAKTCRAAEKDLPFEPPMEFSNDEISVRGGIADSAYFLAHDIDAKAIICITDSGRTARYFSRSQPAQPVLACTPDKRVARNLALYWGILPIVVDEKESNEVLLKSAIALGKKEGLLASGDRVVFTGNLSGHAGNTNLLASVEV